MFTNLYDLFDLPDFHDDQEELRRMYRLLGSRWHPRRNVNMYKYASQRFKELSKAYEVLADKERKNEYDRMLKEGVHEEKFSNVLAPFKNDKGLKHYDRFFNDFLKEDNSLFNDDFFKKIDSDYDKYLEKQCVKEEKHQNDGNKNNIKSYQKSVKTNTIIKDGKKVEKKTTTIHESNGDRRIIIEEKHDDGKTIQRTEFIHHDEDGNLVKEITVDEGTGKHHTEHKMLALNNKKHQEEDDIEIADETTGLNESNTNNTNSMNVEK